MNRTGTKNLLYFVRNLDPCNPKCDKHACAQWVTETLSNNSITYLIHTPHFPPYSF